MISESGFGGRRRSFGDCLVLVLVWFGLVCSLLPRAQPCGEMFWWRGGKGMQVTVDVRRGPSWENEEGERANRTVSVRPPVRPSIHRGEMQTQTQMQTPPGLEKKEQISARYEETRTSLGRRLALPCWAPCWLAWWIHLRLGLTDWLGGAEDEQQGSAWRRPKQAKQAKRHSSIQCQ